MNIVPEKITTDVAVRAQKGDRILTRYALGPSGVAHQVRLIAREVVQIEGRPC